MSAFPVTCSVCGQVEWTRQLLQRECAFCSQFLYPIPMVDWKLVDPTYAQIFRGWWIRTYTLIYWSALCNYPSRRRSVIR